MKQWTYPILALLLIAVPHVLVADEPLPLLEDYGALPRTSLMALSPDGTKIAARYKTDDMDVISIADLAGNSFLTGVRADEINPRRLTFANENIVLLVAGGTYDDPWIRRAFDYSSIFSFDLKRQKVRRLLRDADGLLRYQSGLGKIVGMSADGNILYMPAYYDTGSDPTYSLFAIRTDRRSERRIDRGNPHTTDWFVDKQGEAIVREDFDDKKNVQRIWRVGKGFGRGKLLYEEVAEIPGFRAVGLGLDGQSLVIIATAADTGTESFYLMDLEDGAISKQILKRDDAGVEAVITDSNRVVHGVGYSGFFPSYYFFDEKLNERVAAIQDRLPGQSSRLVAHSDSFEQLIFAVEGGWSSGHYMLFDSNEPKPALVGERRPAIAPEHVARTYVTSYAARDGLQIPALVTAKEDIYEAGSAPLIVMPHGGPESYDRFGFDWMAQYFASRGFVVLQPQFRGSSGFGRAFTEAGLGEWGGKMQTDLDDGVQFLVDEGVADAKRICMVGSSYGGYAALAAGAFSPNLYRCIVSIAGVSDLYAMLKSKRRDHGKRDWVVSYWSEQFGSGLAGRDFLESISPAHHANAFAAPVLLVHGKDDTVVPISQSKRMHKALNAVGVDVTFVQLDGEDHWLTQAETRLQMLQSVAEFIDEHL